MPKETETGSEPSPAPPSITTRRGVSSPKSERSRPSFRSSASEITSSGSAKDTASTSRSTVWASARAAYGETMRHSASRSSTVAGSPTRETLGRFFNDDLVRFETHAEALEMMRVKGWKKTAPQKLKEYAAQYLGERYDEQGMGEWIVPPRWFSAWNRYAAWLKYAMTATPYADVRLSFDSPFTGYDLSEPKHRTSRVVILRRNGRKYAAVMMKDGWYGWDVIEKPAYQDDPYERLVLSGGSGMRWQTLDAEIISELVRERRLCLFAMDEHPFFDALTDDRNRPETLAGLSRNVEF